MERKICFILDASNQQLGLVCVCVGAGYRGAEAGEGEGRGWSREGRCLCKDRLPPMTVGKSFYRRREQHAEAAQSARTMILRSVIGGLIGVTWIVLSTINFPFQGQSFSRGHFSEVWQLVLWLQSGHHVS